MIFPSVHQCWLRQNDRFRTFWFRRDVADGVQVRRRRLEAGRDRDGGVEVLQVARKEYVKDMAHSSWYIK